jgi:hypothetical protein
MDEIHAHSCARDITPSDLEHIHDYGQRINPAMEAYVHDFYSWLRQQPEYADLLGGDDAMLRRIPAVRNADWREFFSNIVNDVYVATHRAKSQVGARPH